MSVGLVSSAVQSFFHKSVGLGTGGKERCTECIKVDTVPLVELGTVESRELRWKD